MNLYTIYITYKRVCEVHSVVNIYTIMHVHANCWIHIKQWHLNAPRNHLFLTMSTIRTIQSE